MPAKKKKSVTGTAADDEAALEEALAEAKAEAKAQAQTGPPQTAAEEDEEGPEDEAQAAGQGKKKKNKKKKDQAGAEEDGAEEAPAEASAEVAADEEAGEAAEDGSGGGKKRKKNKKKKVQAGDDDGEEAPEEPAAPDAAESGDEDGEDAGEGGEAGEGGKKKKKNRRGKKKKGPAREDDEAFQKWCDASLASLANGSDTKPREELCKPDRSFIGYRYSGSLRPWHVTPRMRMPEHILKPDYALDVDGRSESERIGLKEIPILQGEELLIMREACKLGREVLDVASRYMKAGVTGDQVDRIVYQACLDRGIYPSPLNYNRFPKSVCVSPNEVICHGIPDCRPIEEGDIVNLDVSIFYKGYHSDLNETFFIGECDDDSHRLVRTAYRALEEASKMIRPGTFYRDVGNAIHSEAVKSNCSVVSTYCGHGVGVLFHGPPRIPHYRKNKAVGIMKPGHVFTIEPMINLGSNSGDKTWPDDWTAVTPNGSRSAQFEHTFLVTEDGFEVLTARPGTDRFKMPAYDPAMFQC